MRYRLISTPHVQNPIGVSSECVAPDSAGSVPIQARLTAPVSVASRGQRPVATPDLPLAQGMDARHRTAIVVASDAELVIRDAANGDVDATCAFGAAHIPAHYQPLIGRDAALAQVRSWWNEDRIKHAVQAGNVVVAAAGGAIVGVAERGQWSGEHMVWKLYVHPDHHSRGIGTLDCSPRSSTTSVGDRPATRGALRGELPGGGLLRT